MVNIIPNRTAVKGKVESIIPHPKSAGYSTVTFTIIKQKEVKGFRNLFDESLEGQTITAMVLTEALEKKKLKPGSTLQCQISQTRGPEHFINPESLKKG